MEQQLTYHFQFGNLQSVSGFQVTQLFFHVSNDITQLFILKFQHVHSLTELSGLHARILEYNPKNEKKKEEEKNP
jgi:hypothetical protein